MSRGCQRQTVTVETPHGPVSAEVHLAWVRCDECGKVSTAVGCTCCNDADDLTADAAEFLEVEFDRGRELCGECDL